MIGLPSAGLANGPICQSVPVAADFVWAFAAMAIRQETIADRTAPAITSRAWEWIDFKISRKRMRGAEAPLVFTVRPALELHAQ